MGFEKLLSSFGDLKKDFLRLNLLEKDIREIYLRIGKKMLVYTYSNIIQCGKNKITSSQLTDIFAALCEYSVHAYKKEICDGYITVEGGMRIGICGTAIYDGDKIVGIKNISALNIRIPHEIKGAANKILHLYKNCGILFIGPPCSGKTTVLRDIARQLSAEHRTAIIDERSEIAGVYQGTPNFDVGFSSVMDGFLKTDGMIRAVRSLSPEIIICDEFGGEKDIESAMYSMKSGANIIASMHAFDREDFCHKTVFEKIIKSGIFEYYVFLNKKCEIYEIIGQEEFII